MAALYLRDAANGEYLGGFAYPRGMRPFTVPFWSPDGKKILLSGGWTGGKLKWTYAGDKLCVWDISTGQLTEVATDIDKSAVACSPDMRHVAAGKADGSIALWQCDALEKGLLSNARLIPGQTWRTEPAGFSPDGTRLVVTAMVAGKVLGRLCSTDSGQCLDEWQEEDWNRVHEAVPWLADWAGDGACFSYSSNSKNTVTFRGPQRVLGAPGVQYLKAAWSHDEKTLAAWCDGTVCLVDRRTQKVTRKISAVPSWGLAWSPDDKTLAVSCGPELKVKLIPMDEKAAVQSLEDPAAPKGGNTDMCWSPDGKTLAAIDQDSKLKVWDVASGKRRYLAEKVSWGRDLLCWLDEGKTLAAYGKIPDDSDPPKEAVVVWDAANGKLLRSFSTDGERSISFAPRKGLFAVAGPGAVRLRSLADGEVLRTVAFLRNKRQLGVGPEGHWHGPPGVEAELRCLVLTDSGQEALGVDEFAKKYGWKNDPAKAMLDLEAAPHRSPNR